MVFFIIVILYVNDIRDIRYDKRVGIKILLISIGYKNV